MKRDFVEYLLWGCIFFLSLGIFGTAGLNYYILGNMVGLFACIIAMILPCTLLYLFINELIDYYNDKRDKNKDK